MVVLWVVTVMTAVVATGMVTRAAHWDNYDCEMVTGTTVVLVTGMTNRSHRDGCNCC